MPWCKLSVESRIFYLLLDYDQSVLGHNYRCNQNKDLYSKHLSTQT